MDLSDEQQAAFDGVRAGLRRGFLTQTVGGYAGTGKTVLVKALADALPGYAVSAFTGKASFVLRQAGVARAKTYHSLIYVPEEVPTLQRVVLPDGTETLVPGKPRIVWHRREELDVGGIIVDEASMVADSHYRDLASFGLPLVFVGDHGQLEPVGEDAGLMADPDYTLSTIHRNANEIAHFGAHLRAGRWASEWRYHGPCERVRFISPAQLIDRMRHTEQAIVAYNATRVALNRQYRAEVLGQTGNEPVAGDRLIVLKNSRALGLFNGQQVTVEECLPPRQLRVRADEGRLLDADCTFEAFNNPKPDFDRRPDAPVPLDFAYAITAHKSQGSEWDSGVVVEQYCRRWDHARWTYTSATRFKNRVYWTNPKWK
jgi:exodeoxyribonuclease-5